MKNLKLILRNLKDELDDICAKNGIEYSSSEESDNITGTANIFMTAKNLKKFIQCFDKFEGENRVIEWMGNNETFPGLFVRYIDTSTTYCTPYRLVYEKHLGICITIQILRPKNRKSTYYKAFENAYENIVKDKAASGKRLEPILRKKLLKRIKTCGKEQAVKETAYWLLEKYTSDDKCKGYWIKNNSLANIEIADFKENSADYFCDTDISYKELNLERYSELIESVLKDEEKIKRKLRKYKVRKQELLNSIFRLYYRYYFYIELDENFEKIERLYDENKLEELNSIIHPYISATEKYGEIYISERVNSLLQKIYGTNVKKNTENFSENDMRDLAVYNYEGNYIKILGGCKDE